jgi:hypothetical protein
MAVRTIQESFVILPVDANNACEIVNGFSGVVHCHVQACYVMQTAQVSGKMVNYGQILFHGQAQVTPAVMT